VDLVVVPKRGAALVVYGPDAMDAFDAEGRLYSALRPGRTFRRCLDNAVVEIMAEPASAVLPWERSRRRLPEAAALAFLSGTYDRLLRNADALTRAARAAPWPGGARPADWVARVLSWNAARLRDDGQRFRSIYAPVGLLPPDQHRSVVLQPTVGCPYNRCTFCDFYRGQHFRVRPRGEFRQHAERVRDFFGAALSGRRWLFCGEGDALSTPTVTLAGMLEEAADVFAIAPPDLEGPSLAAWLADHPGGFAGFAGFVDERSGACKGSENFARLRALGLRRAYVGLETGHEELHRELRKPGTVGDAVQAVEALHDAGVEVGVVVLLGAGGRRFSGGHVRDTLRTLRRMSLRAGDIVYLSPLRAAPASAYERWATAEGVAPLTPRELAEQHRRLAASARRLHGPKVATYDIGGFLY
jgi:hypothetical protein